MAQRFPAMRWPHLRRILKREPLSYRLESQRGSHAKWVSDDYPTLRLAFHDRAEIPPSLVRKILVKDVGLSEEEALKLL